MTDLGHFTLYSWQSKQLYDDTGDWGVHVFTAVLQDQGIRATIIEARTTIASQDADNTQQSPTHFPSVAGLEMVLLWK